MQCFEKIDNSIKTLLSESYYQQQDLNTIKDDLGALKFGLAYVQHTTFEINEFSQKIQSFLKKLKQRLRNLFSLPFQTLLSSAASVNNATETVQTQLQTTVEEQGTALLGADTDLDALKQAVMMFMNTVQTSFSALQISQTIFQDSVVATLESIEMSVEELVLDLDED